MNNKLCPYTCKDVQAIDASREHIIPDALGGANAFALNADRARNSRYGETVDTRLVNSPLAKLAATALGLDTRSGTARMKERASLVADGSPVDATLHYDDLTLRLRKPVVHDEQGNLVGIRGFAQDPFNELERIKKTLVEKGKTIFAGEPVAYDPTVKISLVHNFGHVSQGLAKIAYLATVWTLGDDFIATAAASQYRTYIDAESTKEDLQRVGLANMLGSGGLETLVSPISRSLHVICCIVDGGGVLTMVRLFDNDFLSAVFNVDIPDLPLLLPSSRFYINDAVTKTMTTHVLPSEEEDAQGD